MLQVGIHFYIALWLAAAVGGERWERWIVLHASGTVGMELTGRIPLVLRVLGVMTNERVY